MSNIFKADSSRQSLLLTVLFTILSCLLWGFLLFLFIKSPLLDYIKNAILPYEGQAEAEGYAINTRIAMTDSASTQSALETTTAEILEEKDSLKTIALDAINQYAYPLFFYAVSEEVRLPDDFPNNKAQLPIVEIGEVTVAEIIREPLTALIADARKAGFSPYLRSGFRSINDQYTAYSRYVAEAVALGMNLSEARTYAQRFSAEPGYSEHHLGLAVDLLDYYYPDWIIARNNYDKGLYLWLRKHAHEYGFVISYPTGSDKLMAKPGSGYAMAEPWHLRFVGKPVALWLIDHDYLDPQSETTVYETLVMIAELIK